MLALTLASLDQNIVSTALPRIVSELGGLAHLSWVVTGFLVASTATAPLYGKLSDMYGRRPAFATSILIFLVGSILCGIATSMSGLIAFRTLQGIGAGGLFTLAQTTIGDLVSPRERGRYQGLFAAVFVGCSVAGPLIGGLITDTLSWRWVFFVNLPVGLPALALIMVALRSDRAPIRHRIDYAGAALLVAGTSTALLVLSWGGNVYAWTSPVLIGLALLSLVFFVLLVAVERRAAEPMIPLHLFKSTLLSRAVLVVAFVSMALYAASVFLPLFFQLLTGASPSEAGLRLVPLLLGLILSSIVGGRVVSRTGRYKPLVVAGLGAATLAYLAMAWSITSGASLLSVELELAVIGIGLGFTNPNLTTAIQGVVARSDLGAATATTTFFRSLGGAAGVALAGAILAQGLSVALPRGLEAGSHDLGLEQIRALPADAQAAVFAAYRHGLTMSFLVGASLSVLAFLFAFALPDRRLGTARAGDEAPVGRAQPEASPQAASADSPSLH